MAVLRLLVLAAFSISLAAWSSAEETSTSTPEEQLRSSPKPVSAEKTSEVPPKLKRDEPIIAPVPSKLKRDEPIVGPVPSKLKRDLPIIGPVLPQLKRDVPIIGPVPTSYRGQASGLTTFDGVVASDLQLPRGDFSTLAPSSSPNVYNFDGKQDLTYDGIVSSDLMAPYPHFTVVTRNLINSQPNYNPYNSQRFGIDSRMQIEARQNFAMFQPQGTGLQQADTTFNEAAVAFDLTLPSPAASEPEVFTFGAGKSPSTLEPSTFELETPTERYRTLQEQYQATLEEYRKSLQRFREQLNRYSSLSTKK